VTENKKLRLYGIPVAKWGKVYEKMCGICGFATPASAEETDGGSRRMTDTRDSRPPTGRIAFDELDDVLFKLEPKLVDTNSFFIIMFGDDDDFVQAIKVGPGRIAVEARVASGRPVLAWPRGLTMTLLEDVSCDDYTIHAVEVAPDRVAVTVLELIDAYGLDLDEVDVEFSE
jgi:hypothetical protein